MQFPSGHLPAKRLGLKVSGVGKTLRKESPVEFTTEFISYHRSGEDLHLRTTTQIIFVSKTNKEMIEYAKKLQRGQPIRVEGEQEMSSTISNMVVKASKLEGL